MCPLAWDQGPDTRFADVLSARSSERRLVALSRAKLGALLWHAARVRSSGRVARCAAPSAGALHPIALVVLEPPFVSACLYDPFRHALGELAGLDPARLGEACRAMIDLFPANAGTFIVALGEFARTAAFYENSESLVWRDAGCVLATLHLTAAWMKLGSCLLGVLGSDVADVICRDGRVEPVGAMAVGEIAVDDVP